MATVSISPAAAVPTDGYEQRHEQRYPARAGVKLSLQIAPGAPSEDADLCNISLHGLGILTTRFIKPGSRILLRMGMQRMEAEVRHCSADKYCYRAGVVVRHSTVDRSASSGNRDWDALLARNRREVTRS